MWIRRIAVLMIILCVAGCGYRYTRDVVLDYDAVYGMKKVVVLPFENLTPDPHAGPLIADLFASELISLQHVTVYERPKVQEFLASRNIRFPKVVDRSFARDLGKIMGVDGVFYGSVTEFVYRPNAPINEQEEPVVGLNIRLVDVKTGRVIWVSTRASSSYDVLTFHRDPLTRIASSLIKEMINGLFKPAEWAGGPNV